MARNRQNSLKWRAETEPTSASSLHMTGLEKEKFTRGPGLFQRIPQDDWLMVGWAISLKALLFVFGVKAVMVFDNRVVQSFYGWLEIWNRWDARRYLEIARDGYHPGADIVVYPVFPILIRAVAVILRDDLCSALLISAAALIGALIIFRRLVRLDYSADVAVRAGWFLLIFPTAYFLQVGYTESLFLVFVFGAILASRVDRWWLAGVLGMFAAMTRANGLALLPTLAVEAGHQFYLTRRWRWPWCWLFLVVVGTGTYLAVNWNVTGDCFAFVKARHDVFRTSYDWPWVGIGHAMSDLHRLPSQAQMVGSAEIYFVVLTFVCAVVSWIRLRPAYATWITVNLIGFTSLSFIQSAPRYTLVCFPVFILLALLAEKRFWLGILSAGSLLFFAFFAVLFARGWWAF